MEIWESKKRQEGGRLRPARLKALCQTQKGRMGGLLMS
jgi:hypothetical protein